MAIIVAIIVIAGLIGWFGWVYGLWTWLFSWPVVRFQDWLARRMFKFFERNPDVEEIRIHSGGYLDIYFKEGAVNNVEEPFSPSEFEVNSELRQNIYRFFGSW